MLLSPCDLRRAGHLHRALVGLVHGGGVDDILKVFAYAGLTMVAKLLDDLEAVEKGTVVPHVSLPLRDADCVV